jgi:hypothetical protein
MYYYEFQVGTAYWARWGLDDRTARRLLARWLRLQWPKYRARKAAEHPGSIADAIDNGWHGCAPEARIVRRWAPTGIVPCVQPTMIESFPVTARAIAELDRVWG